MPDDLPRVLRLSPDWSAAGLWDEGSFAGLPELAISPELRARALAWNRYWEEHRPLVEEWDHPDSEQEFIAEGWAIASELRRELPMNVRIVPAFDR